MKAAPISLVAACAACVALAPASTEACGPMTPEELARMAVDAHLRAVEARDLRALVSAWSPAAQVTSVRSGGKGPVVSIEPIASAARRWITAKPRATFSVREVAVEGDGAAALVDETAGGEAFDDTLFLAREHGVWRIVGAVSRSRPRPARGAGGY